MPQTYYLGRRSDLTTGLALLCLISLLLAGTWGVHQLPPLAVWTSALLALTASLVCLVVVGLCLRREWARRLAIGLLWLAMAACLSGLWWQHLWLQSLISDLLEAPQPVPAAWMDRVGQLRLAAQSMAALLTLGLCLLLAGVVRGLRSAPVRQAFSSAGALGNSPSR